MPALSLKNNESTFDSLRKYFGGELHLKEKIGFMMNRIMFALFDQRRRRKIVIKKKRERKKQKKKKSLSGVCITSDFVKGIVSIASVITATIMPQV